MKKALILLMSLFAIVGLVACGGETEDKEPKGNASQEKLESEYPYPSQEEKGYSKLIIDTPSGDSSDGNVPVLILEEDTLITQIGYTIENFDGDKEVFFYINKVFVEATQGGEMAQSSLDLSEWLLEPGTYEVVAAQFEDNDPNKEVVKLSKASYEIKTGS